MAHILGVSFLIKNFRDLYIYFFWVFKRFHHVCMKAKPLTPILPHKLVCCFKWLPGQYKIFRCSKWLKCLAYFAVMGELRSIIIWQLSQRERERFTLALKACMPRFLKMNLFPYKRVCLFLFQYTFFFYFWSPKILPKLYIRFYSFIGSIFSHRRIL